MCGDHGLKLPPEVTNKGSPPHVRGPHAIIYTNNYKEGITPACAGTTLINRV